MLSNLKRNNHCTLTVCMFQGDVGFPVDFYFDDFNPCILTSLGLK